MELGAEPGESMTVTPLVGPLLRTESLTAVVVCPFPWGRVDWGVVDGRQEGPLKQGRHHGGPRSVPPVRSPPSRPDTPTDHHDDVNPRCHVLGIWSHIPAPKREEGALLGCQTLWRKQMGINGRVSARRREKWGGFCRWVEASKHM